MFFLVARASRCVFRSAGLAVREKCEKAHSHSVPFWRKRTLTVSPFCIYIYICVYVWKFVDSTDARHWLATPSFPMMRSPELEHKHGW